MSVTFKNPADAVTEQGSKAVAYGASSTGKTTLCATAGVPTCLISAEAGLLSIRNAPNTVQIVEVHSVKDVQEVLEYLKKEGPPPWVCLDSVSELAELCLAEERQKVKNKLQAYGEMADIIEGLIKGFRDLPNTNVLFTAKQARNKDDSNGTMLYEPGMPGQKLAAALPYYFDLVLAARVFKNDDGTIEHWLQTQKDEQYEAKDRSGLLDLFEKPNLAALEKKVSGAKSTTKKAA